MIVLFAATRLVQCTLPPCAPPVQHEVAPPPPPNEASPQPVHGPQVLRQLARGSRAPHDCQPLSLLRWWSTFPPDSTLPHHVSSASLSLHLCAAKEDQHIPGAPISRPVCTTSYLRWPTTTRRQTRTTSRVVPSPKLLHSALVVFRSVKYACGAYIDVKRSSEVAMVKGVLIIGS